jgi:cadmium resistance protein CadD (predicted permease)
VVGQYVGFAVLLAGCLAGALGAGQLPDRTIRYLGLVPILLGLWAAAAWVRRRDADEPTFGVGTWWAVAGVTIANGGDNIGVYVPAFAGRSVAVLVGLSAVFLVLVGVWCGIARLLTAHPAIMAAVRRWGDVITPVALIVIGCVILAG